MIPNLAVPVVFKVYTEFLPNRTGLEGNFETAKIPESGYVYIYRELRSDEANDDGTRVRLWSTNNIADSTGTALRENTFGIVNNYFFVYSREVLPVVRQETIRKDIHSKIISRNNITVPQEMPNNYVRACYIPLIKENVKREYLIGKEDVIYKTPESTEPTVILLHDWYGYLEKYANEYQEKLRRYYQFFDEDIYLSDFETDSTGQYTSNRRIDVSDNLEELSRGKDIFIENRPLYFYQLGTQSCTTE